MIELSENEEWFHCTKEWENYHGLAKMFEQVLAEYNSTPTDENFERYMRVLHELKASIDACFQVLSISETWDIREGENDENFKES